MMSALIMSGAGRYADPWHDYPATSARIADVLVDVGLAVEVSDDVDRSLVSLVERTDINLLVVNAGISVEDPPDHTVDGAVGAGLLQFLRRGSSLLAMHSAASTLPDIPEWESIIGARWVNGMTMHPEIGHAEIHVHPDRHQVVASAVDFEVWDERYSFLRVAPDVVALASHEYAGMTHPLLWVREHEGSRVAYDALGHDERSYQSPDHTALLGAATRWLVDDRR